MNNVFLLRDQKGMTQEEFAEYCNVPRISIARYEAGAQISRANAVKIAGACKVSTDFVLGRADDPQPQKEPIPTDGLDEKLVNLLVSLSPAEAQRVRDFVAGLKAAHTT